MPQIEIRSFDPEDIAELENIEHDYQTGQVWQMERIFDEGQVMITFREIRLPRMVKVDYPRRFRLSTQESDPQTVVLVAVSGDVPVGYIRLKEQLTPSAAWISDLVIDKGMRRKGIGTALVLAAQEWASGRNIHRIVMEMQSKNHPAIQMALKLGYQFSGYNDHYYPNQDIALFFARYLR
jgi:ribosomal protein S18 acetylase RimI-like enzyme